MKRKFDAVVTRSPIIGYELWRCKPFWHKPVKAGATNMLQKAGFFSVAPGYESDFYFPLSKSVKAPNLQLEHGESVAVKVVLTITPVETKSKETDHA